MKILFIFSLIAVAAFGQANRGKQNATPASIARQQRDLNALKSKLQAQEKALTEAWQRAVRHTEIMDVPTCIEPNDKRLGTPADALAATREKSAKPGLLDIGDGIPRWRALCDSRGSCFNAQGQLVPDKDAPLTYVSRSISPRECTSGPLRASERKGAIFGVGSQYWTGDSDVKQAGTFRTVYAPLPYGVESLTDSEATTVYRFLLAANPAWCEVQK